MGSHSWHYPRFHELLGVHARLFCPQWRILQDIPFRPEKHWKPQERVFHSSHGRQTHQWRLRNLRSARHHFEVVRRYLSGGPSWSCGQISETWWRRRLSWKNVLKSSGSISGQISDKGATIRVVPLFFHTTSTNTFSKPQTQKNAQRNYPIQKTADNWNLTWLLIIHGIIWTG